MNIDFAQMTAIGGRQSNQDALAFAREDHVTCFVVSDGTGGHEGGEIAARLVIESLIDKFVQEASFSPHALRSYVDWAVITVAQWKKQAEAKQQGMSATMAAILIDNKNRSALWAHMGDTRIYMFRAGKIQLISKDHSLAQRFVDAGYAEYAQIRQHPQRNILFAAIGAEGDTFPEVTQEPIDLLDGDAFLLCTDGLWEWIADEEIEASLQRSHNSQEWLEDMCAIAEANFGPSNRSRDNFSAFTICLTEAVTTRGNFGEL